MLKFLMPREDGEKIEKISVSGSAQTRFWRDMGTLLGAPGRSWASPGCFLAPRGRFLDASWKLLGTVGHILVASWVSRAPLGPIWDRFGLDLGGFGGDLGRVLKGFWKVLGNNLHKH